MPAAAFALVKMPAPGLYDCPDVSPVEEIELAGRVYKNRRGSLAVLETCAGDLDAIQHQRDLRHLLAQAMVDCLPVRQRMVIVRRYFEGSTLQEVADELRVTIPAVSRIENNALRRLENHDNLREFAHASQK